MTWLEQIEAELEKIEPDDDTPPLTRSDSPDYLKNAERHLGKVIAPSVNFKGGGGMTAVRLGGIVGHKLAYVKPFIQGFRLSKQFPAKTPRAVVEQFQEAEKYLKEYYPLVLRTTRRCIAIALRQPLRDAADFVSGLARALEKGSLDTRGSLIGATTATEFYWVLLWIGPRLQYEVRSLNHMHQLCRRWFGQRAGDLKTTEKRCQRIGLKFGKRQS
jgi:hypothetical protein